MQRYIHIEIPRLIVKNLAQGCMVVKLFVIVNYYTNLVTSTMLHNACISCIY